MTQYVDCCIFKYEDLFERINGRLELIFLNQGEPQVDCDDYVDVWDLFVGSFLWFRREKIGNSIVTL